MLRDYLDWERLRLRLLAVTAKRKMKAALARESGVTPQAVYEWLTSKSFPTADTTLWLDKWVSDQEEQQKAPERVTSTPESEKNRPDRKSRYDNPTKSGLRKRP
jgi:hypothetical protein